MNWISNVVPPKIRSLLRRETPENLWVKCPDSGELVFHKDLEANLFVVPNSGYHMRMPVKARLESVYDGRQWEEIATPEAPADPLKFRDVKRYTDRIKEFRAKTGANDSIRLTAGTLETMPVVVAVQDFDFLAGTKKQAPVWVQRSGLEWAFRLASEPRRLGKRYVWGNSMFALESARTLRAARRARR